MAHQWAPAEAELLAQQCQAMSRLGRLQLPRMVYKELRDVKAVSLSAILPTPRGGR